MTPLQLAKAHRTEARKVEAEIAETTGRKRVRAEDEAAKAAARFMRAQGRKAAAGDPDDLLPLIALRAQLEAAITAGTEGLLEQGRSFTEIGDALGISRQAARQRFKRHTA